MRRISHDTALARRLTGARGVRGVAFLYFTVVVIPVVFLSAALAVDFTRIIIAARETSNAAAAAALAGAWQMEDGVAALNASKSTAAAVETFCYAQRVGATHLAQPAGSGGHTCSGGGRADITVTLKDYKATNGGLTAGGYTTVEVTARHKVPDLVFFNFFGAGRSFTANPITRSASVCVPGDTAGATQGNCQRPVD